MDSIAKTMEVGCRPYMAVSGEGVREEREREREREGKKGERVKVKEKEGKRARLHCMYYELL